MDLFLMCECLLVLENTCVCCFDCVFWKFKLLLQCLEDVVCTAFWDLASSWYSCSFLRTVLVLTVLSMWLIRIVPTELQELIIADSESSSIRAVNLKTGGSRLLAGGDPVFPENLFRVFVSWYGHLVISATLNWPKILSHSFVMFSLEILMRLAQMRSSNIPWVLFMPVTIRYM